VVAAASNAAKTARQLGGFIGTVEVLPYLFKVRIVPTKGKKIKKKKSNPSMLNLSFVIVKPRWSCIHMQACSQHK
jgi:hypothetical protein